VLPVFGVLGFLNGYLPAWTDRIGFWTLDGDALRSFGVLLFLASAALRHWPVVVLGDRFSGLVAIQPGHTLVTGGIVRHRSYAGMILNSLGWSLAFRSVVGVLITAPLTPPIIARIYAEEALLSSQFGAEYDAFQEKTKWRLIPGLW
jgi:protein-S-isoprenylcysteine O-methyltransferase Ste14